MAEGNVLINEWHSLLRLFDLGDASVGGRFARLVASAPGTHRFLAHSQMSARGIFLGGSVLLLVCIVPPIAERMLVRLRIVAPNFRGELIPTAYGVVVLFCAACPLLLSVLISPSEAPDRFLWLACICAFGILGLIDDLCGEKGVKGLRGHLTALLRDRRVTTGLVKAVGGLIAAWLIAIRVNSGATSAAVVTAGVIALSANAANLLDLRPGRACGIFCGVAAALTVGLWVRSGTASANSLLYVLAPALVVLPRDGAARAMLGDTGSNLLGASLGLAICTEFGLAVQIAVLIGLVVLHFLAERVSITRLIEQNPFLRAIDRLTGIR